MRCCGDRQRTVGRQASDSDDRNAGDQKVRVVSGDRSPGAVTVRDLPWKGAQRCLVAALTALVIEERGELCDGMPRDVIEGAAGLPVERPRRGVCIASDHLEVDGRRDVGLPHVVRCAVAGP